MQQLQLDGYSEVGSSKVELQPTTSGHFQFSNLGSGFEIIEIIERTIGRGNFPEDFWGRLLNRLCSKQSQRYQGWHHHLRVPLSLLGVWRFGIPRNLRQSLIFPQIPRETDIESGLVDTLNPEVIDWGPKNGGLTSTWRTIYPHL